MKTWILTSFRFLNKDGVSFVIASLQSDEDTCSGIIGDSTSLAAMGINFTILRTAKSAKIPFIANKIGKWIDKDGVTHDKYSVEFASE